MKYKIVTIRDRAADLFGQPSFTVNLGQTIRSFGDQINVTHTEDRPNQLNQHPEDFDLYLLGEYDDETGTFTNLEQPKMVAVGKDYIKS